MPRKTPVIVKHPTALRDIVEYADHIARTTSLAAAERFVRATEQTITRLSGMPGLGSRWDSDHPRLDRVRFFPIAKFRNHLVFYLPVEGGIEVLRVLRGARNIATLLDEEDD